MTVFEILDEYVHAKKNDIDLGNPVIVEVRDTDTFERLIVKAHIVPPGGELEGGHELVLRTPAPWRCSYRSAGRQPPGSSRGTARPCRTGCRWHPGYGSE